MELILATAADAWLTIALETDPRVMAELGGPWPEDAARASHRRRVTSITEDLWFTIVPVPGEPAVGTIGLWASEVGGVPITETGWSILPEHQGRGHGSAALRLVLELARQEPRWGDVHAFPGVTNGPSNGLCRKFGSELLGQRTVDYAGRLLHCNHWVWRHRSRVTAGDSG